MLKSCFLSSLCIPFDRLGFFLDLISIQVIESDLSLSHTGHFQVSDIINISGIFQDCRNIRCNIGFSILYSQDHRAVFTCHIDFSRIILKHDRQCIGTADTYHGMVDGIYRSAQILLIIIVHQFHCHLCICR